MWEWEWEWERGEEVGDKGRGRLQIGHVGGGEEGASSASGEWSDSGSSSESWAGVVFGAGGGADGGAWECVDTVLFFDGGGSFGGIRLGFSCREPKIPPFECSSPLVRCLTLFDLDPCFLSLSLSFPSSPLSTIPRYRSAADLSLPGAVIKLVSPASSSRVAGTNFTLFLLIPAPKTRLSCRGMVYSSSSENEAMLRSSGLRRGLQGVESIRVQMVAKDLPMR